MRFIKSFMLVLLAFAATGVSAATINFDFAQYGTGANNTLLPNSITDNNVTATGFKISGNGVYAQSLWQRNQSHDHGLGVCSEGEWACRNQGGDVNELDNDGNYEGILLENKNGENSRWTQLWISSLDGNGGRGANEGVEDGTLLWFDDLNSFDFAADHFSFGYGDAGSDVEFDLLSLAQAGGFDPSARYVAFLAGSLNFCDTNNDYLVWKGAISNDPLQVGEVPEPADLGLFVLALAMLGFGIWRRRVQQ